MRLRKGDRVWVTRADGAFKAGWAKWDGAAVRAPCSGYTPSGLAWSLENVQQDIERNIPVGLRPPDDISGDILAEGGRFQNVHGMVEQLIAEGAMRVPR
jgi:hypothetical protein